MAKVKVKNEDLEIETEEVETVEAPIVKKAPVKISAKFKTYDVEGNKMIVSFDSEGADIEEALNALEFPKGVNALVNVSLSQGTKKLEKAFAPHKARATLEHKDVVTFRAAFRGF